MPAASPTKCPKCGMKKSPTAKMCPDCMKKMKKKWRLHGT